LHAVATRRFAVALIDLNYTRDTTSGAEGLALLTDIKRSDPDSLYNAAHDYINTHGKDSHGEPLGKYFIHGLGHHVGLNVHDANDYSMPLDRGMIFTLEPGIYIPEEKLGIRIEDMFTVDKDGKLVMMTRGLARTADEIEKAMAK